MQTVFTAIVTTLGLCLIWLVLLIILNTMRLVERIPAPAHKRINF